MEEKAFWEKRNFIQSVWFELTNDRPTERIRKSLLKNRLFRNCHFTF